MQPVVRAIDVGFGYTKYVTHVEGNAITCEHFPSVAAASVTDPAERSWGGPRDTIALRVDQMFYEAGPDIDLALGNFRPQLPRTDDYLHAPEYLALLRIALDYMRVDTIDLLVTGLPVGLFAARKSTLERLASGDHPVSKGRIVHVKKALAVAQPQGALVCFAAGEGKLGRLRQYESLIIDAGSRTFDWLVTRGMRLVTTRSNSVNRGVHNVLTMIADEISHDIGEPFRDLEALDHALRKIRPLTLWGKPYPVEKYRPMIAPIAYDAVQSMLGWAPSATSSALSTSWWPAAAATCSRGRSTTPCRCTGWTRCASRCTPTCAGTRSLDRPSWRPRRAWRRRRRPARTSKRMSKHEWAAEEPECRDAE